MSRYRVFIKPLVSAGVYASDFTEVSNDVIKIGAISESLDNTTYDLGILKTSGLSLKFRNDHGRYSDVDSYRSMFDYKRQDSIVKVTWDANRFPLYANFFKATGYKVGGQVTIFEGLLDEISAVSSITEQNIEFRVAGYDSLLEKMVVPSADISIGDTFSEVIFKMLDQAPLNSFVNVSQENIVCAVDEEIDSIEDLENITVRDALNSKSLLLASSSTLYIKDGTVFVSDRSATEESKFNFYGQASSVGIENIFDIRKYRDGFNKIFNYVKWGDTSELSQSLESVEKFGVRKIEVSTPFIDNVSTAKIANIIAEIRADFQDPKTEFELVTSIGHKELALFLKDKVTIDYPTILKPADENAIPIWGQEIWGSFRWPYGQYSLTIDSGDSFKIMSRKIDPEKDQIIFDIRKV